MEQVTHICVNRCHGGGVGIQVRWVTRVWGWQLSPLSGWCHHPGGADVTIIIITLSMAPHNTNTTPNQHQYKHKIMSHILETCQLHWSPGSDSNKMVWIWASSWTWDSGTAPTNPNIFLINSVPVPVPLLQLFHIIYSFLSIIFLFWIIVKLQVRS